MEQYTVRTGENIFDVAVAISGTIEGIWDLLVSNEWLSVDTELKKGMVLNYHEGFIVRNEIKRWLNDKGIIVKNGHHYNNCMDLMALFYEAVTGKAYGEESLMNGTGKVNSLNSIMGIENIELQSIQNFAWDDVMGWKSYKPKVCWDELMRPKIVIDQYGNFSGFKVTLNSNGFVLVDWGDNTGYFAYTVNDVPYGQPVTYIEHDYEDNGRHVIKVYGMYGVRSIDFSELNGIYYVVSPIALDDGFVGNSTSTATTDRLLLTKE